jgi:dTDP-4-amino-4,6-dideoxygalactose transaminase
MTQPDNFSGTSKEGNTGRKNKSPRQSVPYRPLDHVHRQLHNSLKDALVEVLDSNWYVLGQQLEAFESEFADYVGVQHAVGVGSGHDALMISLLALGIGKGDEVILPGHTFFATALAVHHTGARPVLIDVDPVTCNMDISLIGRLMNDKTRAIIPVHLYGNPCDMSPIMGIAEENGLLVTEDFAQAHGARYKESACGSIGHINATSFYPIKNLGGLGDGGMITTQSDELASMARKLRNYGGLHKNKLEFPGYNSRLDEIQAAILKLKLAKLNAWNEERSKIALLYSDLLKDLDDVTLPAQTDNSQAVHHIYPLRTAYRDQLKAWLEKCGVETLIHYAVPIHRQPAARAMNMAGYVLPVTEEICNTELSLPIYPGLTEGQVTYVCEQIATFFQRKK